MIDVVTFDAQAHAYKVGTREIPGVTRTIQQIDELDGIPRDLLERAAQFGRHVHKACHLWDLGTLDTSVLDPALRPYLAGWIKFVEQTGARIIESERLVYHKRYGYCGTADKIIGWDHGHYLVDVKSSATIPRSVRPQTAAYREAYMVDNPKVTLSRVRYCVHLTGDGRYKLKKYSDRSDFDIFLSCLNLNNWRAKNL